MRRTFAVLVGAALSAGVIAGVQAGLSSSQAGVSGSPVAVSTPTATTPTATMPDEMDVPGEAQASTGGDEATAQGMSDFAAAGAERNGVCDPGEFCYAYNSGFNGSISDHNRSIPNLGSKLPSCYSYKTAGQNGYGRCVKNDAAAVWNRTGKSVTVFYNSNYGGASQKVAAGEKVNLRAGIKNQNASHRIGDAPSNPGGGWRSPAPAGTYVSAGFGAYPSGGPHNGTDFAYRGTVASACNGTVASVNINWNYANRNAYGVSGSTNYLWINCSNGVKMGYAHFFQRELAGGLTPGAQVRSGQALFPVGNQGNSSGYHLHFQVSQNGGTINGYWFLEKQGVGMSGCSYSRCHQRYNW